MLNQYFLKTLQEEGKRLGIPSHKNRALVREYLQSKIIYYLYEETKSAYMSFIGGTSLRLLRNLDRFSEDLDFDNLGISFIEVKKLFNKIQKKLKKEGCETEFKIKKTNNSAIGEIKFLDLLFQLKISSHITEKLVIKINYTTPKIKPSVETAILNRFGLLQQVMTNTAEFLFSQKIRAIFTRGDLQPRDFYDAAWFLSHRIMPDKKLFPALKVKTEKDLFLQLHQIYLKKVKPSLAYFKKKLSPFLIDEKKVNYLDLFDQLVLSV